MDQYRLPVMVMEKMQNSLRGLAENYDNIPLNVMLSILDEVCLGLTGVEEAVSHWSGKFFKHGHTCVESRVTYRI